MTLPKKLPFAPVLRSFLEEEGRSLDHPTSERLSDYHAGRLSADETDLLERHLRVCQECSGLLHDLAEFEEFTPAPAAEALADRGAQAAWQRLRERLPEGVPEMVAGPRSGPVPVVPPKVPPRPSIAWWRRPEPAYAVAATLLLCVIGLSFSVRSLSRRLDDMTKPKVNGAFETLFGEDDPTRGEVVIHVPQGGEFLSLALHLDVSTFATYEAEVHPAGKSGGRPLWTIRGLKLSREGRLSFDLRETLPPGSYQIDLFGLQGSDRRPITKYLFRIASP